MSEPVFLPGAGRRILLILALFAVLYGIRMATAKYWGQNYASDPACQEEHWPTCRPYLPKPPDGFVIISD